MSEDQLRDMVAKAVQHAAKGHQMSALPRVALELPKEPGHGDYATNIALSLAKPLGKNPMDIAKDIVGRLGKNKIFSKVEIVPPGFINFTMSRSFFVDQVKDILKNVNSFGRNALMWNHRIAVEYTDPNPFKEFHVGHFMSNSIGESLSRILEFHGAHIKRFCYQGDVGMHTAKAVWGLIKLHQSNVFPDDRAHLKSKMKFLGMAYAKGAEEYEKNDIAKQEIIELNRKIFEGSDREVNKFYDRGKVWSLQHFNEIYAILGTNFDYFVFESELVNMARQIVNEGLKKNIFEQSQGAIVFKGEKYGLHTRVFINAQGIPTYEAKDLALANFKYQKYPYDRSVVATGNEQNDYFKVMLVALTQLYPRLAEKTTHVGHGMLRLPEGKMGSRTGKAVTFESLLEQVEKIVEEKIQEREFSDAGRKEVKQKVAVGALKYSILKQASGSDVIYDVQKSVSFEGDSGPYLQYSCARASSAIKKAQDESINMGFKNLPEEAAPLERLLGHFPEAVRRAGEKFEPHYIALYLTELAREFNAFYALHTIVDRHDPSSPYKIALTHAFLNIMKNGLWLLSIPVLEKM